MVVGGACGAVAGAVVGGAIGFCIGGPAGALAGAGSGAISGGISGMFAGASAKNFQDAVWGGLRGGAVSGIIPGVVGGLFGPAASAAAGTAARGGSPLLAFAGGMTAPVATAIPLTTTGVVVTGAALGIYPGIATANAYMSGKPSDSTPSSNPKIIQSGGNKIKPETARTLNENLDKNLHRREWGRALEKLKKQEGLDPNHHGLIDEMGNYLDKSKNWLGNLEDYL